jgi:hypothetical protein
VGKAFGRTTSNSKANGGGSSATALILDDLDDVSLYSLLDIGGNDNSGAGWQVTALAHGTNTATIESALSWSHTDPVLPFLPTPTYTGGAPIYGTLGSLSFDGGSTEVKHIRGSISMTPNVDLVNEEFGDSSPADVMLSPGKRACTLSLEMLVKKEDASLFSEFGRKEPKDIRISIGTTSTEIMQIDANVVEFDPVGIDPGESGAARVTLAGKMRASSTLEDEFSITLI